MPGLYSDFPGLFGGDAPSSPSGGGLGTFAFFLGGYPPPTPPTPPNDPFPPTSDYVSDWGARLLSRLYEQFKGKPNLSSICTDILGPQFQSLEDTMQTLLSLPSIDQGEGAQLDVIGRIVGQPRNGIADDVYKIYLHARILANRSNGNIIDIYKVFTQLFTLSPGALLYIPGATVSSPASFVLRIRPVITDAQANIGAGFLADTKADGVRAILEWQETPDAGMFTTATAVFVNATANIGDTSVTVISTSILPLTGSVTFDPYLTGTETLTYNVTGPTTIHLGAPLANSHAIGSCIEFVGDPGMGWSDTLEVVGGAFEGAA